MRTQDTYERLSYVGYNGRENFHRYGCRRVLR